MLVMGGFFLLQVPEEGDLLFGRELLLGCNGGDGLDW